MLNHLLHSRLKQAFGDVDIVNEDQPIRIADRAGVGRQVRWKIESGEQYRVNCPFCGDTRQRLYISYAWGMDSKIKFPSSKLVICQNDRCDANPENDMRGFLQRKLSAYFSDTRRGLVTVQAPKKSAAAPVEKLEFPRPEWSIPVNKLGRVHQDVRDYLSKERRFNLDVLANAYGVVYAYEYPVVRGGKDYNWLAGRLFIPIKANGSVIGWQARANNDRVEVRAKYFNCPGWQKSSSIYNIDYARRFPLGLLVEGVTDVWRVGGGAFCTFGKSLSTVQHDLIVANWQAIGVLYDPDTDDDKNRSAMKALLRLKGRVPKVFRVHLPDNRDPAKCDYSTVWDCIERDALAAGVVVRRPV